MTPDELHELRKDAKRYRYMRANAVFHYRNGPDLYWYLPRGDTGLPADERLDKAIDEGISHD
jgi:hypothetical protein